MHALARLRQRRRDDVLVRNVFERVLVVCVRSPLPTTTHHPCMTMPVSTDCGQPPVKRCKHCDGNYDLPIRSICFSSGICFGTGVLYQCSVRVSVCVCCFQFVCFSLAFLLGIQFAHKLRSPNVNELGVSLVCHQTTYPNILFD